MDFRKVVIMTDLDGTLLTDKKEILPRDMEAIDRFRKGGGIFTLATGRGYSMAEPVAKKLALDFPAVIFNGAAVYDFSGHEFLWQSEIDSIAKDYIKLLMEKFPDIGIEVLCGEKVYVPAINEIERMHLSLEKVEPVLCPVDDIPGRGWLKVLTAYPPDRIHKLIDFAHESCGSKKIHWVRSEDHFFEMLPSGVNKGSGFQRLLEIMDMKDSFTVGAGDYNNDIELIRDANLGVAVGTAQQAVKDEADIVVCDNNSGAIAQVIEYIEKM